ncbi:MAG: thiamine pyrophosphate-requiring protein [Clostridiales Family XIII bacterium]|jgi:acetolactate synthase-1/2/3 large subunit|nr:thiamine pyrophosphate-requiring protein [Clostridiales Family XIII bacterium]
MAEGERYTAADAFTDALVRGGIEHIFLNSGTDYPALIETWAKYRDQGRGLPQILTCPHENVAMSAAQGYAQLTGRPAGVFVHVDVGTLNIGGALANAFRGRIPVLVFAGMSPYTMEGELEGSRDNMIQFIQNVTDQGAIVREYVKHCVELRSGANIQQAVYRALQLARTDVKGPVYLMAAREVLEQPGRDIGEVPVGWAPPAPLAVERGALGRLIDALLSANDPIVVTSSLGRQEESVGELIRLCERLAVGVVEAPPSYMNFPGGHALHLGNDVPAALRRSDLVLVIDSDVPWLPALTKFPEGSRLFWIDADPVKDTIPLWNYPAEMFIRADSLTALRQINEALAARECDGEAVAARMGRWRERRAALRALPDESAIPEDRITPQRLLAAVGEIADEDTIILNETITNTALAESLLPRSRPGTRFHSEGSSLGWHGGAAIGAKLARPDREVIALTGDGTYMFSCPSAVYWTARKYGTPFMTVVFDNGGWTAPKIAVAGAHPDGYAARTQSFWAEFAPASRYELIAEAAGGAYAASAKTPDELRRALREGREAVKAGRCAVINAALCGSDDQP